MRRLGTVAQLWRYPVKSMRGEPLPQAHFDPAGMAGDRRFAFTSTAAPAGKPLLASRERSAMLLYQSRLEPSPHVTTPEGRTLPLPSPELLAELQYTLAIPGSQLNLECSPGLPLTDVRPISLVSVATLRGLEAELGYPVDAQRFRSNLILALDDDRPFAEDDLPGRTLCFGDGEQGAALLVQERIPRCRMVSLDPETTELDPLLLPHLARAHNGRLGIYARVLRPGTILIGDALYIDHEPRTTNHEPRTTNHEPRTTNHLEPRTCLSFPPHTPSTAQTPPSAAAPPPPQPGPADPPEHDPPPPAHS